MTAAPTTTGDGSLPAHAAPGAGCNAPGSATPHSRGCCRPVGRDTSQIPAPPRSTGYPRMKPPWGHSPGGSDAPEDTTEGQRGHPQPSPPGSRAQPPSWEVPGPTFSPHMPFPRPGTTAGTGFALQAPAPAQRHRCQHYAAHCLDPLQRLPRSTQLSRASCMGPGLSPAHWSSTPMEVDTWNKQPQVGTAMAACTARTRRNCVSIQGLASEDRSNAQDLHRRVQYSTERFLCAALLKTSQRWHRHAALGIWSKPLRK